jgi:hypothetical protein
LEGETRVVSSVVQMSWEVLQSTTRCRISIEREDKRVLMSRWSCCFYDRYEALTVGKEVSTEIT